MINYTIYEPVWGVTIVNYLNHLITTSNPIVGTTVGVLADIFVFTYPIFLVYWFLSGYFQKQKLITSLYSIKIGLNSLIIAGINIGIQAILFKDRPIFAQGETLNTILKELPTASFPSDHAAISMIIGLSAHYYGKTSNNKLMQYVGIFRIVTSFIMGVCRVAAGVHRPTDIIAGWLLAYLIFELLKNSIYIDKFSKILIDIRQYVAKITKLDSFKQ